MHLSAIQPKCQCLNHSGFYPMGGGKLPPQDIKRYIVQITIEKALLECQYQPSMVQNDLKYYLIQYNLKTQIFPGGQYPQTPLATSLHCMCL